MRPKPVTSKTIIVLLLLPNACGGGSNDDTISTSLGSDSSGDPSGTSESSSSTSDTPASASTTESADLPRCPRDLLIDDLEHGMNGLPAIGDRMGSWYTYNDESPGAMQDPPADGSPFVPTMETAATGLYAARTHGSGYGDWGAGFGFDLNNHACPTDADGNLLDPECSPNGIRMRYDVSAYSGVRFYARSLGETEVEVQFKVPMEHETPVDEGGTCDAPKCSDSYFKRETFTPEWELFEVDFKDLMQGGFGEQFSWDPTAVFGLQWQVPATETEFDIVVDEVCFF